MRSRLVALILVPTIAAVLLGGLRVVTSVTSAAEFQRVSDVATFTRTLSDLIHELQLERDMTADYVATNRASNNSKGRVNNQQDGVNRLVTQVTADGARFAESFGDIGRQNLARVNGRLGELKGLREITVGSKLPALPSIEKYNLVIADLLRLYDENAQVGGNEELKATAAAVGALARAKNEASITRGLLASGINNNRLDPVEVDALTAADKRQEGELSSFKSGVTIAERQRYDDTVTGPKVDKAEFLHASAFERLRGGGGLRDLDGKVGEDSDLWFQSSTETLDRMHDIERVMLQSIITRADGLASEDQRGALTNIIVVIAIIGLVLLITTAMARSLVRPLRRLRSEALEIAGHRLPDLVQRLREHTTETASEVKPIGVSSADEIGEVARAFDEVHREAVRLAGEESRMRNNVSAMFVNLSRRTQTLVERQIALIDGLEQGEQDEQRLANLFKLDHLATRMRRNSENLLVLAGQEPARRWSQPVELTDVVRASLSEVEGYERVVMNIPADVALAGQAVNDVIHLLAELVENALSFSARDTKVIVSGNRIDGGGVMVSVTDSGIGMTQEEIAATNWRLANPPVVDVSVSRRMGLFVVGRLALRNGIRVQLRPHDTGGLTAMVLMPEALLAVPAAAQAHHQGNFAPSWTPQAAPDPSPVGWNSPPRAISSLPPGHPSGPYPQPNYPQQPPPQQQQPQQQPQRQGYPGQLPAPPQQPSHIGHRPQQGAPPSMTPPIPPRRRFDPVLSSIAGIPDSDTTGPLPVVHAASDNRAEEYLPIFASVESAWFQSSPPESDGWKQTVADTGWEVAAQQPSWESNTPSGLPKRVPKANLVPGSADSGRPAMAPMPPLSPDRARSRLSSLQQGIRQGRAAVARGELGEDDANPWAGGPGRAE